MSILSRINAFFAFSTRPVTVLTLLIYAALFVSTIWIQEIPSSAPTKARKQLGVDLDTAWRDLQAVRRESCALAAIRPLRRVTDFVCALWLS